MGAVKVTPPATDLTPELLDKIEALAKAATPGPWSTERPPKKDGWQLGVTIGATRGGRIYAMPPGGQMPWADALHIAAASPDVVLALVVAARKLDRVTSAMEAWAKCADDEAADKPGSIGHFLAAEIRRRMKEALHGD